MPVVLALIAQGGSNSNDREHDGGDPGDVLAPVRLSVEEALDLYPYRWSVERMFFDLKEVLNRASRES